MSQSLTNLKTFTRLFTVLAKLDQVLSSTNYGQIHCIEKRKENAVFRNYWDLLSYLYNAEVEVGKPGNVSKTKESFAL